MNESFNHKLIVIAPTVSPNVCGVSDYAFQTALEFTKFYKSVEIGVLKLPDVLNPSILQSSIFNWKQLLKQAYKSSEPIDILLHYTPLSYAQSGYPHKLIRALKKFKKIHPNNQVFIFIHEAFHGSFSIRIHHTIRELFSKWTISQIGKIAAGIAVVTEGQKKDLGKLLNTRNIHLSLVGANISPDYKNAGFESLRESGVWIVFGMAHTRLWAVQAHLQLLKELYATGKLKELRSIGPLNNYSVQEAALIRENLGSGILIQLGVLEQAEISKYLLSAEAALVRQNEDSMRKSGSLAALAAHAVPVICEVPKSLDEPPGSSFFQPKELRTNPNIISNEESRKRRMQMHNWFWSTRSWEAISKDLRDWMLENTIKSKDWNKAN